MPAIATLTDVRKRYGAQEVLRGVSLSVETGELLALCGRSGSGKSTLLNILGGLDRRFDGKAEVLGLDLAALGDEELARFRGQQVGFVFQSFNLLDHLSVKENVALPAFFRRGARVDAKEAAGRAVDALSRVGVIDHANKRPGELSGGQKQRVAIARALYAEPSLLVADEPTGNLDTDTGRDIIALFGTLNAAGLTIVVVTHEDRVSHACTRVLKLEDGQLIS